MPSPRPTGSGPLKILLLPQLLKDHVLDLIAFLCNSSKPILGFLLRGAFIHYCLCDSNGFFLFVVIVCFSEAHLATQRLVPQVLGAISHHMPLLLTGIACDSIHIGSHTSLKESSSRLEFPSSSFLSKGIVGFEGVIWFVLLPLETLLSPVGFILLISL